MHAENPGVDLYRRQVYIVADGRRGRPHARGGRRVVALGLELARGEAPGAPAAEGYFARGVTHNVVAERNAA